ncbi:MAG TPA: glycosyltransferase family A protein [Thermoanaerobaculia bacterium]|nr:glycosyltransferase family A protein [Thermoanaerobaculia bacterium]
MLVAVRNGERWIEASLRSLLAQTHKNLQIVVVDNGSADRSAEIAAIGDSRIEVHAQPSGGLVSALNEAYRHVAPEAEAIARQDADDLSEPARIAEQLRLLASESQLGLVGTGHREIDYDGSPLRDVRASTDPAGIRTRLRRANPFAGASILMRRSVFDAVKGYDPALDGRVGEDYDFLIRVAERFTISAVSDPLYIYRTNNPDSMCGLIGYDYREPKAFVAERARRRGSSIFAEDVAS